MSNFPTKNFRLIVSFIALFLHLSCSTDTDLLSEVVLPDSPKALLEIKVMAVTNKPVVIDVTGEGVNGQVTDVSEPENGTANVNPDNTITYTPDSDVEGTDEFEYTVTNPSGTNPVVTGTVTVTITDQDKVLPTLGEQVYYVTTSGKSGNNGRTETNAWNIEKAFSSAKAGDVIYIKAGNYGNLDLVVANSGTSVNPIYFIGYKNAPWDIISNNGSTFKYGVNSYTTADYPTIQGVRSGGKVTGTGINIKGAYVEMQNIQIKDKETGIASYGSNNKLINVIIHDMGNHTGYSGWGVVMNGARSELRNSFILNGVQLFTNTKGDHQIIDHNWLGCDQSIGNDYSTDYYLLITGSGGNGADYNTISNNTVWRQPKQFHQGHGIIIKGHGQYNKIVDNIVINCPIELSFDQVANNTVSGGTVTGTGATGDGDNVKYAFILIANGAHHNTFKDIKISGDSGIRFSDWNDGWTPSPDTDAENAGHDNFFKNITFDNLLTGIEFSWHWNGPGAADNNIFEDCIFSNIKNEIFRTERKNSRTIFKNCSFINNTSAIYNQNTENTSRVAPTGVKVLDVKFENCTWNNNAFQTPI